MAPTFWCSSVFLLIILCSKTIGGERTVTLLTLEREIVDNILNTSKYNAAIRPLPDDEEMSPTAVKVNMYVRTISRIDDVKMQYSIQITLRQKWTDARLKYGNMGGKLKYLNLFDEKLWTPDLFISNEKSGFINNLMKPNTYFRIFPDGGVLYSARVSLVLSCPMNLQWFPFDHQMCTMSMASYGFTTEDVVFLWDEEDPVQISKIMTFPHFTLQKTNTEYCHSKTNTGEYSCLRVNFFLKRSFHYYLGHIFIPCLMLVNISWLSFWLDHQIIMTRLFTVFGPLVVLFFKISDFNASLSPVAYMKSIDVWTGTCLTFVFAALVELVIVDYRWRRDEKKRCRATGVLDTTEEDGGAFDMPLVQNQDRNDTQNRGHPNETGRLRSFYYRWVSKLPKGPKRLDIISRYLFPVCFTVFLVVYIFVNLMHCILE